MIRKGLRWLRHLRFVVRNFNEFQRDVVDIKKCIDSMNVSLESLSTKTDEHAVELNGLKSALDNQILRLQNVFVKVDTDKKINKRCQNLITANTSLTYETLKIVAEILTNLNELNRRVAKHHSGLNAIVVGKRANLTD